MVSTVVNGLNNFDHYYNSLQVYPKCSFIVLRYRLSKKFL